MIHYIFIKFLLNLKNNNLKNCFYIHSLGLQPNQCFCCWGSEFWNQIMHSSYLSPMNPPMEPMNSSSLVTHKTNFKKRVHKSRWL